MNTISLAAVALLAAATASCSLPVAEQRTYTSPTGAYELRLHGRFGRYPRSFFPNRVFARVSKFKQPFADIGEVHHADYLDQSFDQELPTYQWISERTLHFFQQPFDGPCDVLVLENGSGVELSFIKVGIIDLIVAIDVQPGATETIPIVPSYDPSSVWVTAEAEVSRTRRHVSGAAKVGRRPEPLPSAVSVSIRANGIDIRALHPTADPKPGTSSRCGPGTQASAPAGR